MQYDVIVIGGGSAGLMASVAASRHGASVLLVDKGDRLGRKLGISGGGRCNVTNNKEIDELIKYIPGNGRFLYSALANFSNKDIIAFFEDLGIRLKEEDNGRMFPVSDKAQTVVDALIGQVRKYGVDIKVNSPVERILYADGQVCGIAFKSGETISGTRVIVASGGKSVPKTGSTGDGYAWAADAGHTITELYPTEVPITSQEPFIRDKQLQGLALRSIVLSVWGNKGKRIVSHEGDMLFTHFGLSGPATLRCSQFVVKQLRKTAGDSVLLTIDLHPESTKDELQVQAVKLAEAEPKKALKNVLKSLLPERLIPLLFAKAELEETVTYHNLPRKQLLALIELMKAFPVHVNGTLSIEEAFVTGGGVHLKEIDPRTMGSKLMKGLYFCGEILDVHGYTGGYNITAAFATGYTAGMHAALDLGNE